MIVYYDDTVRMENQLRDDVRQRIGTVDYEIYNPVTNEFTTVYKEDKKKEKENRKLAYEVYDPKTNKFTNVYIDNVDVSGVENLDSMINELTNAAESMR